MQHVGEKWLKIANTIYAIYALAYIGLYFYLSSQQQLGAISNQNSGVDIFSEIFAFITLIYCSLIYSFVKKYSTWLAYTFGFTLFGLFVSTIFESSIGTSAEKFMFIPVIAINFFSVLYGPVAGIVVVGISGMILALSLAGNTNTTGFGATGDTILFFLRSAITFSLLFILRKKYISDTAKDSSYVARFFVNNEVVKLLTNSIGDGVIIIDKSETVKTINPAALKIVGQESQDVLDLNYRSVLKFKNVNGANLSPDKEPVALAFKEMKSVRQELLLPRKNAEIYVDVTVSVISSGQGKETQTYGAVITLRDISKKKKDEQARSDFISTASHEMRTPVASIEGYLALALNPKVSHLDQKTKTFLDKAYASTQHLGQLFQDLLVSTRAEDGRLTSHPQVIEIGSILERQIEYFNMIAHKKGLGLEFIVGSQPTKALKTIKPLYYAYADPSRIQEVMTNLIDNSIKYTQAGKVTVGLTGNKEIVQIFVRDTGVGIDPEDVPHLFQKFYRVDSSATRTTGGTGLGLFICRKIIELYKGRIWVQSKKGEGSTFYINLPRLDTTQAEALKIRDATKKNRQ